MIRRSKNAGLKECTRSTISRAELGIEELETGGDQFLGALPHAGFFLDLAALLWVRQATNSG